MRKNPNEDGLIKYKFRANALDKRENTVYGWKKAKVNGEYFLYTDTGKSYITARVDGQSIERNTGYIDIHDDPIFEGDYLLIGGVLIKVFSTESGGFVVRYPSGIVDTPLEVVNFNATIANEYANVFESKDKSIITIADKGVETYAEKS